MSGGVIQVRVGKKRLRVETEQMIMDFQVFRAVTAAAAMVALVALVVSTTLVKTVAGGVLRRPILAMLWSSI